MSHGVHGGEGLRTEWGESAAAAGVVGKDRIY